MWWYRIWNYTSSLDVSFARFVQEAPESMRGKKKKQKEAIQINGSVCFCGKGIWYKCAGAAQNGRSPRGSADRSSGWVSDSSLLLIPRTEGSRSWLTYSFPTTQLVVPGCWFQLGPAPTISGSWGVNQWAMISVFWTLCVCIHTYGILPARQGLQLLGHRTGPLSVALSTQVKFYSVSRWNSKYYILKRFWAKSS